MQEYGYNLDQKLVKRLSELTPWRTAAAMVFDWAVIIAAIALFWIARKCDRVVAAIKKRFFRFGDQNT